MKRVCFAVLIFLAVNSFAQSCLHTGLSNKFDYKINVTSKKDSDGFSRAYKVIVEIYNKDKSLFQTIRLQSQGLNLDDFVKCDHDRSFILHKNEFADIADNDYGDIVVADFNFDGKEDFAIKNEWNGNIGVGYHFFIQTKSGFVENKYLTNEVRFFPWILNAKKSLLITKVSPTPGTTIRQYKYSIVTKKWQKIHTQFVWHDKNLQSILSKLEK